MPDSILFNHESPVCGETFVTRKITRALARIKLGLQIRWQGQGVEEKGYLPSPASGRGAGGAGEGEKCIVAVDPRYFRPTEVETLLGDPTKAMDYHE